MSPLRGTGEGGDKQTVFSSMGTCARAKVRALRVCAVISGSLLDVFFPASRNSLILMTMFSDQQPFVPCCAMRCHAVPWWTPTSRQSACPLLEVYPPSEMIATDSHRHNLQKSLQQSLQGALAFSHKHPIISHRTSPISR